MTTEHPDATRPMLAALDATGPAEAHATELMLFGQFVGRWDLVVRWYERGEVVRQARGEWHFGWVLEGRAVQDVWIVPPRVERERGAEPYEYGTSLRFYDPAIGAWRSTWHGPVQGVVIPFIARGEGEEIVLEGRHPDGRRLRWVFSEIGDRGFRWRNLARPEDAGAWELVQDFAAERA
jgi:hypothetical protein